MSGAARTKSFHERYNSGEVVKPPSDRSTGIVFTVVALVVAALWRGAPLVWQVALGMAGVLAILSLAAPWVPCAYTGSSTRTTYGENEEKSVLHVVQDDEGGWTVKRLRTPTRPMILAVGAYLAADRLLAVEGSPNPGDGADVRVRYAVPFDQRDAAAEAARATEAAWLASGAAARVTWEPETTAEMLWGAMHGLASLHRAGRLSAATDDRVEALVRLFAP